MSNERWANIGIAGEDRLIRLLYAPNAKTLVAQFYRNVADSHPIKSLYVRGIQDSTYLRLTGESDSLSYEDPLISPCGRFVLVNILEALKDGDMYSGSYGWYALQLLGLPSGRVEHEVTPGELHGKVGGQRIWVSGIHGMNQDGHTAYCTIGIERSGKVQYYLAQLDLRLKSCELLTALNGSV